MPSLRELQMHFMEGLLGSDPARAIALIAARPTCGSAVAGQVGLYRNTVRSNFIDSLHSSFPVIWRLVGEDYFRQTAREFHRLYPSRSGDLTHVGQAFPEYLAARHSTPAYRYLGDVARLEWSCQEALAAAEHGPLDLGKLRQIAQASYDTLCLRLHPTLRLFESSYPVLRIWEANVAGATEPELIDLDSGSDCLALMRQRLELKFHRLSRGEFAFLESLECGDGFATAIENGAAGDAEFDAGAALRRFVAAEVIVDFETTVSEPASKSQLDDLIHQ
jgi:Putative DNA-binding domain